MQGKSIFFATSIIKLTTAFILLPTAFIKLATAFIILPTAKTKFITVFNILATAYIILHTATIKRLTEKYNLLTAKIHLTGATTNKKKFATAQEKAHLQSATPNANNQYKLNGGESTRRHQYHCWEELPTNGQYGFIAKR